MVFHEGVEHATSLLCQMRDRSSSKLLQNAYGLCGQRCITVDNKLCAQETVSRTSKLRFTPELDFSGAFYKVVSYEFS